MTTTTAPADPRAAAELLRRADEVLAPTYGRPDRLFVRGSGCWLEDAGGERFLDLTSGIAVNALGHGSAVVREAIEAGAEGLVHVSNLYHTAPAIELAEELVSRSFATSVFFSNSGAESNEGAIKFARLAAGDGRRTIVYFDGAFHGRTLGALAATDRPDFREPVEPVAGGFVRAPWDDEAGLIAIDSGTAAVIVEPVQGEAGIRAPSGEWLRALRRRCDATGALLILDEVQSGLGRTGRLWAYEHFDLEPDLMTLAKPLAGGLPMGAVLLGERATRAVRPGIHATTFGGGPLVARVARDVVRTVAEAGFLAEVRRKAERLRARLEALRAPGVREIRGLGLLLGVQVDDAPAVKDAAFAERLLIVPAGDDVLRFLPPLDAPDDDLDEGVARFGRALERVHREAAR